MRKHRVRKIKKIGLLVVATILCLSSTNDIHAATHTHSDACYNGTKHSHTKTSDCHTWGNYKAQCPWCNGKQKDRCATCNAVGTVPSTCRGTRHATTTGATNICGTCGGGSVTVVIAACSTCGQGTTLTSIFRCACNNIVLPDDWWDQYENYSAPCSSFGVTCTTCKGLKYSTTASCPNCVSGYLKRDCGSCTGGKIDCGTCVSGKINTDFGCSSTAPRVETLSTTSSGSLTVVSQRISCAVCGVWYVVERSTGTVSTPVGPQNVNSTTTKSSYNGSSMPSSGFSHIKVGDSCHICGGASTVDCAYCYSDGYQYANKWCSKTVGAYYSSSGTICSPICHLKASGIVPKVKTQTIVK